MFRDICQLYVYLLPGTSYDATFYVGIMNLSFTVGRLTPGGQQKRLELLLFTQLVLDKFRAAYNHKA